MEHHQDEHITCAECGTTFVFTASEAESFASKRLDPPKRCPDCRRTRRAQKAQGDRREGPPRGHFGGDVNGYRAPMSDPGSGRDNRGRGMNEYRAPGFRDSRPPSSHPRSNQPPNQGARGEYRAPSFAGDPGPRGGGEYRAPAYGGDRGPRGGGEYRAPSFGGDRGPRGPRGPRSDGEYRAPSFGGDRGPARGDRGPRAPFRGDRDQGPPRGDGNGAPSNFRRGPGRSDDRRGPPPDRQGPPHEHRGAPRGGHGPEHAPRGPRPDRPSFPITCAQCGAASEVPFKPQEGREILCRDCYRAKKDAG